MQIRISLPFVATGAMVILLSGCTAASRKAHYAENAEKFFKAGEYDKAKIEYLNVIKIDQANANAYARIGAMWVEEGVPLRAGAFLIKALELAPNDTGSRLNLARVYLSLGRMSDARKEAMTVLETAPQKKQKHFWQISPTRRPIFSRLGQYLEGSQIMRRNMTRRSS